MEPDKMTLHSRISARRRKLHPIELPIDLYRDVAEFTRVCRSIERRTRATHVRARIRKAERETVPYERDR